MERGVEVKGLLRKPAKKKKRYEDEYLKCYIPFFPVAAFIVVISTLNLDAIIPNLNHSSAPGYSVIGNSFFSGQNPPSIGFHKPGLQGKGIIPQDEVDHIMTTL